MTRHQTAPRTREQQIDGVVATAYQHNIRNFGDWARLHHVRLMVPRTTSRQLGHITTAEVDASLTRLAAQGYAKFAPMQTPTRYDKRAAVTVGSIACHLVAMGGR